MIVVTVVNAAGEPLRKLHLPNEEHVEANLGEGESAVPGECPPASRWEGGQWVPRPAQPRKFDAWDQQAQAWVDQRTAQQLREEHKAAIEAERERRITATPIVYDGINLDADAVSIARLEKKLATTAIQLERGLSPDPASLVWRDADNALHVFGTLQAYRAWLEGFALALDERGMQAWTWSWAKKAVLEGMGDNLEALRGFDPVG